MTLVIFEWCLCFTLGGDLQCFFRMLTIYFHVLPYALLLRLAYFLGVLYHFRWTTNYSLVMRCLTGFLNIQLQWHKYKLVSFLTRHHTLPSIFIKDIYHYIFLKNDDNVMLVNMLENWQLCTYFSESVLQDIQ